MKRSVAVITKAARSSAVRIACLLFACASINCLAEAANADEPPLPHKMVSYKDLNMNSMEGVAVLYQRINKAAIDVCGRSEIYELSRLAAIHKCIHESVSRAVAQVNSPMLTDLYEAKNAKSGKEPVKLAQAR